MKKYYITIFFLILLVANAVGQIKVDLGVLSEDREGYYSTELCESGQFEVIFDLNSYASLDFSCFKITNVGIDVNVLSFVNMDTNVRYTPDKASHYDGDGYESSYNKLRAGRYKVIVAITKDRQGYNCKDKIYFECKVKIDVEKKELQFGNLSKKESASYSTSPPLSKSVRFEVFFDIDYQSSIILTYGVDNGEVELELLDFENVVTGEKYFNKCTECYEDYTEYEQKLKAGKYKATILAIMGSPDYEIYINCKAQPKIELEFGNLTEKGFASQVQNICTNSEVDISFNITSFSSIVFSHTIESGNIKFEGYKLQGGNQQHTPYETNKNGNKWDYKYELKAGDYKISITGKADNTCQAKASFSCFAKDLTPPPPSLSNNQNYVKSRTFTRDDGNNWLDNIQYYDGLGFPNQTIQIGATPKKKDLVSLQEYDALGRENETWLPIVYDSKGAYIDPDMIKTTAKGAGVYNDTAPFSKLVYESSPLNRIVEQYGSGNDWQSKDKSIKTYYLTNKGRDSKIENNLDMASRDTLSGVYSACVRITLKPGFYFKATAEKSLRLHIDPTLCQAPKMQSTLTSSDTPKLRDEFLICANYEIRNELLVKNNNYNAGQLYATLMIDEDDNQSLEFKDKLGQVVMTRQINGAEKYDTHYVYDEFGNLCYVLPPMAIDKLIGYGDDNEFMKQYAYIYKYDGRNRCTWKKLPGVEPIFYVYDKADQLIFTQDGEQRKRNINEWTFALTDVFARDALTGTVINGNIKTGMFDNLTTVVKAEFTGASSNLGYKINGYLFTPSKIYSANYYDNYNYLNKTIASGVTFPNNVYDKTKEAEEYGKQYAGTGGYEHKGLLTGSVMAQFNAENKVDYLYSAMYYDNRQRIIQTQSTNHLGGKESEYIAYNFIGDPIKTLHIHTNGKVKTEELYTYSYDHAGRLLDTKHKLNNGTETLIASNSYDELGRLQAVKKGNQEKLKTTYDYNIRSWTTAINSGNLLKQNLDYTYGGNIKKYAWNMGTDKRSYTYEYDNLSRLTAANYGGTGKFSTAYEYDKHGNIASIERYGKSGETSHDIVDKLAMKYTGNQLVNIVDTGKDYNTSASADFKDYANKKGVNTYNQNGALASDSHKGIIKIDYNSLNLPLAMTIENTAARGNIKYTYTASGAKLQTKHTEDINLPRMPIVGAGTYSTPKWQVTTTDYVGNKIYEKVDNNPQKLKRILIDGGYIEDGKYFYYLTDHLGNNRVVAEASGTVVQKTHYYPFGMAFADSEDKEKQPYKYNGKELDTRMQLNTYDYAARYMDPAIGRFTSVDPLAEKYYSWSPYAYVMNNPLKYIDPDGRSGKSVLRLRHIPKMYRAYNTARTVEGLGVIASVSAVITANQMVNGDRSQEVAAALTGVVTNEIVSELNKNLPPDPGWARGQEKNAKDALDGAQAAVAKAIDDNISGTLPSGDPAPKRPPNGTIGKIVIGGGLLGELIRSIIDPLGSAGNQPEPQKPEPPKPEPPKPEPPKPDPKEEDENKNNKK